MSKLYESELEEVAAGWFEQLGYDVVYGPDITEAGIERESVEDVILTDTLLVAMHRLNPDASREVIEEAYRRVRRHDAPTLVLNNRAFHTLLTEGVTVEEGRGDGTIGGVTVRLIDFEKPLNNTFAVVHQLEVRDKVSGTGKLRIPDMVLYVNGLPLGVIELKNPADENADVWSAYNQLQTYKHDIPSLFVSNCVLVGSDDVYARMGSLTAPSSRFAQWRRRNDNSGVAAPTEQALDVLVEGMFEKYRFLDLVRSFQTFERNTSSGGPQYVKKLANYHQFFAARNAVKEAVRATSSDGDGKVGVVWHTQGSGKSLTMLFLAGKLVLQPELENPTIIVITDRNDLDDQLFQTFSAGQALLRQEPKQAEDRGDLRNKLKSSAGGGVYFTTIQKFLPADDEDDKANGALSERRNIVVIADEAHRSQYGFKSKFKEEGKAAGEVVSGFAENMRKALPNASYVGFTGTPVEKTDRNTQNVFGEYIDVYDILRAVEDGSTVPIFYERRFGKLNIDEALKPTIDSEFEEVTEDQEEAAKERLKSQWSTIEKLAGAEKRLEILAADLVAHFEKRSDAMQGGKAMVVGMSRMICARLYEKIIALRPHWHSDDVEKGYIKVVMTGSASDPAPLSHHTTNKQERKRLAERFKDEDDPLKLVIVRDMWLTGFDAPSMHTLYVDKPMQGHNLMQAMARVNRVNGELKKGGLVVDYIGIELFLQEAMKTYTNSGGSGDPAKQQEAAVKLMKERLEVCRDSFHGFDYSAFFSGDPNARLKLMPAAREFILKKRKPADEKKKGKKSKNGQKPEPDDYDVYMKTAAQLGQAFALVMPHEECENVRDELAFFQAVRAGLRKLAQTKRPSIKGEVGALRQIVSNAIVGDDIIDVFDAAGLERPQASILSPEFLATIDKMPHKNLAAMLLARLLRDQISATRRSSVVQAKTFLERLEAALIKFNNRTVDPEQIVEALIEIANSMREARERGEKVNLKPAEYAFYEALADNKSAVEKLKEEGLKEIAVELTALVRKNATIDWTQKKNVQAKLRKMVRRVLKEHKYPPDAEAKAVELVLEQAKLLGINVTEGGPLQADKDDALHWADAPIVEEKPGPLPFVLAVFDPILLSQEGATLRVKTRVDAIEKALAFLAAGLFGFLKAEGAGTLPAEIEKLVEDAGDKPLAIGSWVQVVIELSKQVSPSASHPVAVISREFFVGGKSTDLMKKIQNEVVPFRNQFSHGVTPNEAALASKEPELDKVWVRLKRAFAPLGTMRLVTRASIVDHVDGGGTEYSIRVHQGPAQLFPLEKVVLSGQLREHDAYLLSDGGDVLSLGPMVRCLVNSVKGQHELFMSQGLVPPSAAKLSMMSLIGTEKMKVEL